MLHVYTQRHRGYVCSGKFLEIDVQIKKRRAGGGTGGAKFRKEFSYISMYIFFFFIQPFPLFLYIPSTVHTYPYKITIPKKKELQLLPTFICSKVSLPHLPFFQRKI